MLLEELSLVKWIASEAVAKVDEGMEIVQCFDHYGIICYIISPKKLYLFNDVIAIY